MSFISVPLKKEHRVPGEKSSNALKNVCKFKPCLIRTDTKVHIHNSFDTQMIQRRFFCACASLHRSWWGFSVLTQVFLLEGNLPHSLLHLTPHMPHFTKTGRSSSLSQPGLESPVISRWPGKESSETRFPRERELHHRAHHFIFYAFISDALFFSTATSSEWTGTLFCVLLKDTSTEVEEKCDLVLRPSV